MLSLPTRLVLINHQNRPSPPEGREGLGGRGWSSPGCAAHSLPVTREPLGRAGPARQKPGHPAKPPLLLHTPRRWPGCGTDGPTAHPLGLGAGPQSTHPESGLPGCPARVAADSPSSSSFSSPRSRFFSSRRILLISWSIRAADFSSSVRHQGQQRQVSERAMVGPQRAAGGIAPAPPSPPPGRHPGPAAPGRASDSRRQESPSSWGSPPPGNPGFPALGTRRPSSARPVRPGQGWRRRRGDAGLGLPAHPQTCPARPDRLTAVEREVRWAPRGRAGRGGKAQPSAVWVCAGPPSSFWRRGGPCPPGPLTPAPAHPPLPLLWAN